MNEPHTFQALTRRIHGSLMTHRALLLEAVDTIVNQTHADWPSLLYAIEIEAHLVERTDDAAVGELVALQITHLSNRGTPDLDDFLVDAAQRIQQVLWQVTAIVPDVRYDTKSMPLSA